MKRTVRVALAILLLFTLAVTPFQKPVNSQALFPNRDIQRLPDEVLALFQDGITLDEFLIRHQGPLPHALQAYADRQVVVIVEMERPSLAAYLQENDQRPEQVSALAQRSYADQLLSAQGPTVSALTSSGGTVLDQYTKVYNGILAQVPAGSLNDIRSLPGVRQVHRAPRHVPSLTKSVPLIRADEVWSGPTPYTGKGMRIAIIDTGIDYTHAAFNGPGTPEAYETNDPTDPEETTSVSFPTAKVIGGWDFAGTNYDGENMPAEDPDPLDENGHGTHVASIAAGAAVPENMIGRGVAPDALLYALKVFGQGGFTNLTVSALEWAMDPNQDGDVSDRVDVVNMSLGSSFGPSDESNPEFIATNNLTAMGVIVVASAGNSGPSSYVTGAPASASTAISVAASGTGWLTAPYLEVAGYEPQIPYKEGSFQNGTGGVTEDVTGTLTYVGNLTGAADDMLCETNGIAADALQGQIALIQRGVCNFSVKVVNAAQLGAAAAIIFNDAERGDDLISMGDPETAVTIPSLFIGHSHGAAIAELSGAQATIFADELIQVPYGEEDAMGDFTSQGPRGYDSILKPDVAAPGVEIFAAQMGTGDAGISFSGTSMAAPHVAGLAALLRQAHPDWTPEILKAALMNTAVQLDAPVTLQGSGRVDAVRAIQADTMAIGDEELVALNWGLVEIETNAFSGTKNILVRNLSAESKTYSVTAAFTSPDPVGATISVPGSVTVAANDSAFINVQIDLDTVELPLDFNQMEEYYGFVRLTNTADSTDVLRVPFYLVPRPFTRLIEKSAYTQIDPEGSFGQDTVRIALEQRGPKPSLLLPMTAFVADINETEQRDPGDLRYIGMDYGVHPEAGPLIIMGFNTWGAVHTPLQYFVAIEQYLDVDNDGDFEFVNFNYNLGDLAGVPDNQWVVLQFNLDTMVLDLGSPFPVFSDYNAGYQEWYLPPAWNGLGDVDADPSTPAVSEFAFQTFSYDVLENEDVTDPATVDYLNLPFTFTLDDDTPHNTSFMFRASLQDPVAFEANPPLGVMLVDLFGQPGSGQVYFWRVETADLSDFQLYFLPIIGQE